MSVKAVREVSPWTIGSGVRLLEMVKWPPALIITFKIFGALFVFVVLAMRHYVVTLSAVMAVAGLFQFQHWAGLLFAVVPAFTYWSVIVFATLKGSEATSVVSVLRGMLRIHRIRRMWQPVLFQLKVTSRVESGAVAPLVNVRPTDSGVVGDVITGSIAMDAHKLSKLEREFASGFFVDRVLIRPRSPSMASIKFDWGQHLRKTFRVHDIPAIEQRPDKPALVPFGVRSDGGTATLVSNLSTLVGGVAGSGKSSTMWAIIEGYRSQVPLRLRIVDPSGVEFAEAKKQLGSGLIHDYVSDPKQPGARKLDAFWEDLEDDFNRRMAAVERSGSRWHKPTQSEPLDLLIIDELLPLASTLKKDPTDHIVGRILYLGRKAGFVCIAASQAGQVDALGRIRDLFPQRICHRTESRHVTDAFLGEGAESEGASCSSLDTVGDQGVLYMAVDGQRGYTACRSAWVSDEEIAQIARNMRPSKPVESEIRNKPTSVYAFHNHAGQLLYVGIAEKQRLLDRWKEHERSKKWWSEVHQKTEIETYPNRSLAETAEARIIVKQRPKYNKQHNSGGF